METYFEPNSFYLNHSTVMLPFASVEVPLPFFSFSIEPCLKMLKKIEATLNYG